MSLIYNYENIKNKYSLEILIIAFAIILSGFKIFGYSVTFIIFLPYFFFNYKKYNIYIKESKIQTKLVLYFIAYFILMTFVGSLYINDLRIAFYWIPFFIVLIYLFLHNKILLEKNNFYRENFNKIIFSSGLIYFIIYLIMNILSIKVFSNEYEIQNNFWIGSSAGFHLSTLFLSTLFILWRKINFKIKSLYLFSFILYTSLVSINSSRLGFLYLLIFLFFTIINCFTKRLFIQALLITFLISNTYYYSSKILSKDSFLELGTYRETVSLRDSMRSISYRFSTLHIFNNDKNSQLSGDDDRVLELFIGYEKFKEINIFNKFFGTGWYSSRITIKEKRNEIIKSFNNRLTNYKSIKPLSIVQLQGIVALILDTGILGLSIISFFYFLTLKKIIFSYRGIILKNFMITMLCMNVFCLFIGYPYANLPYWLIFIPGGFFQFNQKLSN